MWATRIAFGAAGLVSVLLTAPNAAASAQSFCANLSGSWDGQYCRTTVRSPRNAVRDIKVAVPNDLIDNPTTGTVVQDYLRTLFNAWRTKGQNMVQDSFGEENYQVFRHGNTLTAVFHEDYHADGPQPNNAYHTFTFDMARGARLQLSDLTKPGLDPHTAIAPLAQPFVEEALDRAAPAHQPRTYPFTIDRWGPADPYSGGYKAWALAPGELILYMPDRPVAYDNPINYDPLIMKWSMDCGAVEAHIPLSALGPVLRPEYS